jgi:hypothetical protein
MVFAIFPKVTYSVCIFSFILFTKKMNKLLLVSSFFNPNNLSIVFSYKAAKMVKPVWLPLIFSILLSILVKLILANALLLPPAFCIGLS